MSPRIQIERSVPALISIPTVDPRQQLFEPLQPVVQFVDMPAEFFHAVV